MSLTTFISVLAWLGAVVGGTVSAAMLTAEYFGKDALPGLRLKTRLWGRFVWLFLVSVCWLLTRNM